MRCSGSFSKATFRSSLTFVYHLFSMPTTRRYISSVLQMTVLTILFFRSRLKILLRVLSQQLFFFEAIIICLQHLLFVCSSYCLFAAAQYCLFAAYIICMRQHLSSLFAAAIVCLQQLLFFAASIICLQQLLFVYSSYYLFVCSSYYLFAATIVCLFAATIVCLQHDPYGLP